MDVVAVVALKPLAHAKTRLASLPAPLRRRLAWCMALDTLSALAAAVDEVVVVSSDFRLEGRLAAAGQRVRVWPETELRGINAALSAGADAARRAGARTVLACVGDLPALRSASVAAVVAAVREGGRAYLSDASGVGTTILAAHSVDLNPAFQGRSAAAHRAQGAQSLDLAVPDARRDVDTEADLTDAVRLGVGPATSGLLDPVTGRTGRYGVVTAVAGRPGQPQQVVTAEGDHCILPTASAAPLSRLRPGQRLHAVLARTATPTVMSVWS